jgi:hypothetical protein
MVERFRQIPMEQRYRRLNAVFEQGVDQPLVEIEAARIHGAATVRQDAAPRDTEAIRGQAEIAHELHVAAIASIVIAGHVAGVAVLHEVGRMAEALPDAGACAIRQRRAFDLVSRRGRAPQEFIWELDCSIPYFGHLSPRS